MNNEDCVGIRPRSAILSMNEDCLHISKLGIYIYTVHNSSPINNSQQKSEWKSIRCGNWHRRRQGMVSRFLQADGTLSVRDNGRKKAHIGAQQGMRQWHEMQPSDESDENHRTKIEPVSFCTSSADSWRCAEYGIQWLFMSAIDVLGFHRVLFSRNILYLLIFKYRTRLCRIKYYVMSFDVECMKKWK